MAGSGMMQSENAQKAHLLQGSGGLGPEIADLRRDIQKSMRLLANVTVEEWTNPPAAAPAGLLAATATVAAPVTVLAAGMLLGGVLSHPRLVTFTTAGATAASAPATAVVTGKDVDGRVQSETVNIAQTAATVSTTKAYKSLTSVVYAAADDVDATVSIGWGAGIGLGCMPKVRAGAVAALSEISAGTLIAAPTGTLALPATNAPYGLYTPAAAPDGTRDYALYYEAELPAA